MNLLPSSRLGSTKRAVQCIYMFCMFSSMLRPVSLMGAAQYYKVAGYIKGNIYRLSIDDCIFNGTGAPFSISPYTAPELGQQGQNPIKNRQ